MSHVQHKKAIQLVIGLYLKAIGQTLAALHWCVYFPNTHSTWTCNVDKEKMKICLVLPVDVLRKKSLHIKACEIVSLKCIIDL